MSNGLLSQLEESKGSDLVKTDKNDLVGLCRKYVHVSFRDEAYNSEIAKTVGEMEGIYKRASDSYVEAEKKLSTVLSELEGYADNTNKNGIFSRVERIFTRDNKKDTDKIGKILVESRKQLGDLKEIVEKSYDLHSQVIRSIFEGVQKSKAYESELLERKDFLENAINEHNNFQNSQALSDYIDGLVEKKIQSDELKEKEIDRSKLRKDFIKKGEEHLSSLAKSFLETLNDLTVVKRAESYEDILEKYNLLSDSFYSVRERVLEELTSIEKVIRIYEVITTNQMAFLKQVKIPGAYIEAVKKLVHNVEKWDEDFSNVVLEANFTDPKLIMGPRLQDAIYDVISAVRNPLKLENNGSHQNDTEFADVSSE